MATTNVKNLHTRIALKYDTYANWKDSELVLLPGEIGLCAIPEGSAEATNNPTVLFKVGDVTTPFKTLKWASALAADVYNWAKAETVVLDGTTIKFKTDDTVVHSIELETLTKTIESDIANIKTQLGLEEGADSVADQIAGLTDRIDALVGEDGTIANGDANTLQDAKDYSDENLKTAKEHTDAEIAKHTTRLDSIDSQITNHAGLIAGNTTAIEAEGRARGEEDAAINAKIGGSFTSTDTVAKAIDTVSIRAEAAHTAITNLTNNAVANNTAAIGALQGKDTELEGKITKLEAFFDPNGNNGNYEHLDEALDTLVEIQAYLSDEGEGSKVKELLDGIDENAKNIGLNTGRIETLEGTVGDTTSGLVKDMDDAQANILNLQTDVSNLQNITSGYNVTSDGGAIKTDVDAAKAAAAAAQADANQNAEDIKALDDQINTATTGLKDVLASTKSTAETALANAGTNAAAIEDINTDLSTTYARYDSTNNSFFVGEDVIIFNCGGATETIPNPT